jgi:large subunit ribosomal protein L15
MKLGDLRPPRGARKPRKRVGRGPGSGHGKTSTKGHKGHKARSGGGKGPGFEGGQMPLYRRIPKRGFKNPFRREFAVVNLSDLARCFPHGGEVGPEAFVEAGLLGTTASRLVKVLGDGELGAGSALTVRAHAFSKAATAKIAAAGGQVEVLPA